MTNHVNSHIFVLGLVAGLQLLIAPTSSFAQHREEAWAGQLAQYCAPKDEDHPDARRLYC
jgi:hypothetical protein